MTEIHKLKGKEILTSSDYRQAAASSLRYEPSMLTQTRQDTFKVTDEERKKSDQLRRELRDSIDLETSR